MRGRRFCTVDSLPHIDSFQEEQAQICSKRERRHKRSAEKRVAAYKLNVEEQHNIINDMNVSQRARHPVLAVLCGGLRGRDGDRLRQDTE